MYKAFSRNDGKPGDRRTHAGLTYEKSVNGKWLIVRDTAFKKLLRRLHIDEGKTLRAIKAETGIPHSSLQKALNEFNLMRSKKVKSATLAEFVDRNLARLRTMYVDDGLSAMQIAEIVNEKTGHEFSETSMTKMLKERGVKIRDASDCAKAAYVQDRRKRTERGAGVFAQTAIDSWNYHLDLNLRGLTFEQYRRIAARFTYMVVRRFPQFFPANARREDREFSGIDMDHQLSRFSGYYVRKGDEYVPRKNPVPLEVLCHPVNLKLMAARANMQKSNRDHHSLKKLQEKIEAFASQHGDIFADYYERYCKQDLVMMHTEKKRGRKEG
jgi:hypothetical protein